LGLDDLVDGVAAPQAGGHHQDLLEAQLLRFRPDHLVRARPDERPGKRVELLDRERLEQFIDLHGVPAPLHVGRAPRAVRDDRSVSRPYPATGSTDGARLNMRRADPEPARADPARQRP
jgi:hypothetical protein